MCDCVTVQRECATSKGHLPLLRLPVIYHYSGCLLGMKGVAVAGRGQQKGACTCTLSTVIRGAYNRL